MIKGCINVTTLSIDELKSLPVRDGIGRIYHLTLNGKVVYVGQTVNMLSRMGQHKADRKEFDGVSFGECALELMTELEVFNIVKIKPELNKKLPVNREFIPESDAMRRIIDSMLPCYKIPTGKSAGYGYFSSNDIDEIIIKIKSMGLGR